MISTASADVGLFDKAADQFVRFIGKGAEPPGPKEHSIQVTGGGDGIEVQSHGQIRGEDLKSLPSDYCGHIKTMEESVRRHYEVWKQV